jgi:hypothetical protein
MYVLDLGDGRPGGAAAGGGLGRTGARGGPHEHEGERAGHGGEGGTEQAVDDQPAWGGSRLTVRSRR